MIKARIRQATLPLVVLLVGGVLLAVPGGSASKAPAAATATAPYCGKAVLKKADGTRWRCTWSDGFLGTKLDSGKWTVMTSATTNYGRRPDCFVNTPANIGVTGGVLKLTSHRALPFPCGRPGKRYTARATSAMISTIGKFSQAYGRFEFRARFPYTSQNGLQSSLWMWPQGATGAMWPVSGEIDVAEWFSNWSDRVIPRLHYGTSFLAKRGEAYNYHCLVPNVGAWHTYTMEWTRQSIVISYDGKPCLRNTNTSLMTSSPFNKPYMINLMQGLGLSKNAPTSSTPLPATMLIDYIRVWS